MATTTMMTFSEIKICVSCSKLPVKQFGILVCLNRYVSVDFHIIQSGPKSKYFCLFVGCNFVNYGVDQFKEVPLLESLLIFQKDACNIYHIPSKYYTSTL